jgi:hypothetical protein
MAHIIDVGSGEILRTQLPINSLPDNGQWVVILLRHQVKTHGTTVERKFTTHIKQKRTGVLAYYMNNFSSND